MKDKISVTKPVLSAISLTSHTLFDNFDIAKYITFAFCAWLANLGDSRLSFNYKIRESINSNEQNLINNYINFVLDHIVPVAVLAIVVFVLIVTFILFIKWLKCRGQFMFLNCAVKNSAAVVEPWRQFKHLANSYFIIDVIITLTFALLISFITVFSFVIALPDIINNNFDTNSVIALSVGLPLAFIVVVTYILIKNIFIDFIVPIMYKKNIAVVQAIDIFKNFFLSHNIPYILLFYLMKIFLSLVFTVLFIIAALVTCCVFCCLNAIPFVGALIWLPVFLFNRYYSICFLEQFGEEWKFIKFSN